MQVPVFVGLETSPTAFLLGFGFALAERSWMLRTGFSAPRGYRTKGPLGWRFHVLGNLHGSFTTFYFQRWCKLRIHTISWFHLLCFHCFKSFSSQICTLHSFCQVVKPVFKQTSNIYLPIIKMVFSMSSFSSSTFMLHLVLFKFKSLTSSHIFERGPIFWLSLFCTHFSSESFI